MSTGNRSWLDVQWALAVADGSAATVSTRILAAEVRRLRDVVDEMAIELAGHAHWPTDRLP